MSRAGVNRHDARTDANQPTIIAALEAIGCKVKVIKLPLDLLVSGGRLGRRNLLVEVKMPGKGLNKEQLEFWHSWPGEKALVTTAEEAIEAVLGKELLA